MLRAFALITVFAAAPAFAQNAPTGDWTAFVHVNKMGSSMSTQFSETPNAVVYGFLDAESCTDMGTEMARAMLSDRDFFKNYDGTVLCMNQKTRESRFTPLSEESFPPL